MAIVQSIAVGKATGSAGNVTFATVKGRVIMKEKAKFVANPRTDAQVSQRSAMAVGVIAWQKFGNLVKTGWTRVSKYSSPYNQFISENMLNSQQIAEVGYIAGTTKFKGLKLSNGALKELQFAIAGRTDEHMRIDLEVSAFDGSLKAGDKITAVHYNYKLNKAIAVTTTLTQDDITAGKADVSFVGLPSLTLSDVLWGAFSHSSDGLVSSTSYLETI